MTKAHTGTPFFIGSSELLQNHSWLLQPFVQRLLELTAALRESICPHQVSRHPMKAMPWNHLLDGANVHELPFVAQIRTVRDHTVVQRLSVM